MKNVPLKISSVTIQPGERITVALPTPELYTCAPMYIPMHIIHGKKKGPTLLVCGSIHGDEINGVVITQRLLKLPLLKDIQGTLIVIPTINIYGMITMSRNLPDRRDLDGSFPGSTCGSFASRLANLLTKEVFQHITHCIDLRTGEPHIIKLSQVHTFTEDPKSKELAESFQAPVILHTQSHRGLLWLLHRQEKKIPTIAYVTGEALRLDENGISLGVQGIISVMENLEMLSPSSKASLESVQIRSTVWMNAPSSGLCEMFCKVGDVVEKEKLLARIFDPFGTEQKEKIFSPFSGIIVGKNYLPILNEGEPIVEIAEVESIQKWREKK